MTELVLASRSTARAAVLSQAGLRFTVRAADIDEAAPKRAMRDQGAEAVAVHLAHAKAALADHADGAMVIGADQILVCEGAWFDKPAGLSGAREHLRQLRGRVHTLVTAIVLHQHGRPYWSHVALPTLRMRAMSDGAIDAVLAQDGPACLATVGAYRIEGPGVQLFEYIEGEWPAILGLPLLPLLGALRDAGDVAGLLPN